MGTTTAASVAGGLVRRLKTGSRRWGLPSMLVKSLTQMERDLFMLENILSAALEKKPFDEAMEAVTRNIIKPVLYEAEDLVDDLEERRPSGLGEKGTLFWSPCSLLWHIIVAHRIKTITRKLDLVERASHKFVLSLSKSIPDSEQQMEHVIFDEAALVGTYHEKKEIKDLLLQNNGETLSILPIIGLPGIGKTSLARLVFCDKNEAWNFDLRIWISLGNHLDIKNIARCIISEASRSVEERSAQVNMDDQINGGRLEWMKDKVQEVINSKSCLIVLDNLWSTDAREELKYLKEMLRSKQNYTKVIVTTCSEEVAELMKTVPSYKLGCLGEDDSWSIFSKKAFGNGNEVADQYTKIGKDIVNRCKGIPLLARSLGSLVHDPGMDTWIAARDDELWKLEESFDPGAKLFTSFKKIYYRMPMALKSCFLYLSVFPKGSNIDKAALIRQWIALDLLRSTYGTIPDYIVGENYIQDLLSTSFLQIHNKQLKQTNDRITFQMPDLVHEFVRYIARDDLIVSDHGKALDGGSGKVQHFRYAVMANCCGQSPVHKDLVVWSKAVQFRNCEGTKPIADTFSLLGHSRIINLSGCPLIVLPASVGKLKNLRYLDVSYSGLETLPIEMSCLTHLESLDLAKTCIEVLPSYVGSFQKLRYFNLHGCERLQKLPPTLGALTNLEHLDLSCCTGIGELPASLCSLLGLRLLDLSGCTKLQELPHQLGNLERLQILNLAGCSRLQKLPESLGNLTFLISLNLANCCELQEIPESIHQRFSRTRPRGLVFF